MSNAAACSLNNETDWWGNGSILVGFDTETTGVDVENDRVVSACITFHDPVNGTRVHNFLLNPGIDIPEGASAVHGITTEKAQAEGQDARTGLAEILDLLVAYSAYPLVAYNGVFDMTIMDREARRHGLPVFTPTAMIDPFILDKALDPYVRGTGQRQLTPTAARYGVVLENAHSADADALAAVLIARAMGLSGKLTADVDELHQRTIALRVKQQDNFEQWLRKQGKDDVLDREWPVISLPVAA